MKFWDLFFSIKKLWLPVILSFLIGVLFIFLTGSDFEKNQKLFNNLTLILMTVSFITVRCLQILNILNKNETAKNTQG